MSGKSAQIFTCPGPVVAGRPVCDLTYRLGRVDDDEAQMYCPHPECGTLLTIYGYPSGFWFECESCTHCYIA